MERGSGVKFVFGGLSCMTAACVTNPIDVIKTRLQIQGELSNQNLFAADRKYKGSVRGTIHIIQTEGISGLYKGLSASLLREAVYSTLRIGGYDIMKTILMKNQLHGTKEPLWKKFTAGMVSGSIGAAIANPTDLVKVRIQANENNPKMYPSLWSAFKQIVHEEGFRGLFKGVGPTAQRAALLTGSQLASYDHCKHGVIAICFDPAVIADPSWKEPIWIHGGASVVAGFICSVVTSPLDLVKTRLMNQRFDSNGKGLVYSGTMHCFKKTIEAEGLTGIYKGFFPNWFRIGPHTIVAMMVYEQLRRLAGLSSV